MYGSDISGDMLEKARANLERAGVPSVWLKQVDARGMTPPCDGPGIILANPIITHHFRLDQIHEAFHTYTERIGNALKVVIHVW